MTFLRSTVSRPSQTCVVRSLVVAAATWSALTVAGCSVDSKGFGGVDAGGGGTGTGATSASGGSSGGTSGGSGGVNGSGGVSATGGTSPGSGGAHASGGSPGSAGHGGSGGVAAGGHVGSGGTGAGGRVGSGGTAGGAGHEGSGSGGKMGTGGSGGKGGQGGTGGQGAETCDQYVADYANALAEARACTVGATDQCQQNAPGTLSYCTGCPQVVVNDAAPLTAIRAQWTAAGCAVPTVCPAIACVVPSMRTCVATDAGPSGGICQASLLAGN